MSRKGRQKGNIGARKGVHPGVLREALDLLRSLSPHEPHVREATQRLVDLADQGRTSGRGVVAALEAEPNPVVLQRLRQMAGIEEDVSLERLIRLARGRASEARRRTNPIACNEGFVCGHCATDVQPATGGFQRNHCPCCLYSLHVDVVPGDRRNPCQGLMEPIAVERARSDRVVIQHRCQRCGAVQRVKAALETPVQPDSRSAIRALSSEPVIP